MWQNIDPYFFPVGGGEGEGAEERQGENVTNQRHVTRLVLWSHWALDSVTVSVSSVVIIDLHTRTLVTLGLMSRITQCHTLSHNGGL